METTFPVDVVKVCYECDYCKSGWMIFDGMVLTSNPPQYPHTCEKCDHKKIFMKHYPYTDFRVKDNF